MGTTCSSCGFTDDSTQFITTNNEVQSNEDSFKKSKLKQDDGLVKPIKVRTNYFHFIRAKCNH